MISPHFSRCRGVALVLVLSLLVLITGLVVGFLVRAGGERTASANYYASATARQLADTAVNLVQAQINEATTTASGTNAWASQPGAIRVFDNAGNLAEIFRLYSSPSLVSQGNDASVLKSDIPPTDWAGSPALWVDLNAPVTVTSGTSAYSVYPILDPRDPANPGTATAPIVSGTMPGFAVSSAVPGATARQPVPMPVQWLYVLQDGKIVVPKASGTAMVTVSGASQANPIVGRIAFWTDDECAKVNINTAAGNLSSRGGSVLPSPWDTPRFKIWEERLLFSENQPVKGEYQRYPGHPATTDLYGIFHALGISMPGYPAVIKDYTASPQPTPTSTPTGISKYLPYYTDDNTSQGGALNTTKVSTLPAINGGVAKAERLYTSLGELLYDPQRSAALTGTNDSGAAMEPRQQLESGKFFLTAHSRSPEVTLFGTPRISMWPVSALTGTNYRTSYDKLAAFCATTGTSTSAHAYYIQRQDARSAVNDYDNIPRNQELYSYLLRLTDREIPGFGGSFNSKYGVSNERDQIVTEMIDYIRCTNLYDHSTTSSTFVRFTTPPTGAPNTGGKGQVVPLKIVENGVTTRGLGRMQTISEIGLLIICTADGSGPAYQAPVTVSGKLVSPVVGSAESPAYASNLEVDQYLRASDGTVVGIDGTAATSPFPANQTLTTTGDYGGSLKALKSGEKRLQAMLLFELACPMMGFDPMDSSNVGAYQINVTGMHGVSIGGQNPFPSRVTTGAGAQQNGDGVISSMPTRYNAVQGTGGLLGFRYLLTDNGNGSNIRYNGWSGLSPKTATTPYRYISNPFTVSASTLSLSGNFTAEMGVPVTTGSVTSVQKFNVSFPSVSTVPLPDLLKTGLSYTDSTVYPVKSYTSNAADWWGFDNRVGWAKAYPTDGLGKTANLGYGCVIRTDGVLKGTWAYTTSTNVALANYTAQSGTSDVVRTLVAKDGDYRLTSALETVDASGGSNTPFEKGPNYDNGKKLAHLFKDQYSAYDTAGVDDTGKLVSGATYSWQLTPKVPGTTTKDLMWDWDSGLPQEPDGPYANKPDEGNTYTNSNSPYYNRESQYSSDNLNSYFTANRIVASPVMFGSLPTGVKENITWRTLLFRPQKTRPFDPSGPSDHLLLDLFNMPVVEPYAISEPFSTAGKVNLNYQIVPFTYITRSTGVRAVLSSELIARVPKKAAAAQSIYDYHSYYKEKPGSAGSNPPGAPSPARLPVDLDLTLQQFETKFNSWGIFKSASEICDIYLVPQGYNWTDVSTADTQWYGDDFALVGDNVRERPYANIYPRLTTKSNTYTVHFRVQALKNPSSNLQQSTWNESTGTITSEYRGSTTVERYLDPSNPDIPDYATDSTASSIDTYYQWRTVSNHAFNP